LIKRTKFVTSTEADLTWEAPIVDAYEDSFLTPPMGFWREMLQLVGIGLKKKDRRSSVAQY
jgi:yeast amino acid transporter